MSDLMPRGIPVNFDGVDRYFLFNFRRIDALQYRHPEMNIFDQVNAAKDDTVDGLMHVIEIVDVMCDGQVATKDIMRSLAKNPLTGAGSLTDVRIAINLSMIESLPIPTDEDDEDPREDGNGIFEIPKFLVIATSKLGLSESEFWELTPRKYSLLSDAYFTVNGMKRKEEHMTLLNLP